MSQPPAQAAAVTATTRVACIVGTAGHIDHGKSALVMALTGVDPDRLPEERKRGMTIELGFAHLELPGGSAGAPPLRLGIVDVPGHERFVRTMVAGATGIDIGMLVLAADDGVMPQTREHVEILNLLGVRTGLIAISKIDLAHRERIDAVRAEIAELTAETSLRDWPIVETSAPSGEGIDEIRATLATLAKTLPAAEVSQIFRMAIDRVFTVHGRGTVVTGSVLSGRASIGQTLELHPPALPCKVRELQSHGTTSQDVTIGQRAALNLTGIDRRDIERGMELATPGYLTPTRYMDARVRILRRRDKPFPTHRRVRVALGTTEAMAMLVVFGGDRIEPGEDAAVQLRFNRPIAAAHGQRFIVRDENAVATIGGGTVIRPASRRLRPLQRDEVEAVARAESDDALTRCAEAVRSAGFDVWPDTRTACAIGVQPDDVPSLKDRLRETGQLATVGSREVHRTTLEQLETRARAFLLRRHRDHPSEPGTQRDRLIGWIDARSAKGLGKTLYKRLLDSRSIYETGPYVAEASFRPALSPEDARLIEALVSEITAAGFDVPAWTKLRTVSALPRQRSKSFEELAKCEPRLVSVGPQQFLSTASDEQLRSTVAELAARGPFKLAEVRDAMGLSRRVVQPLLEHLDRVGFTQRVGDERILVEGQP